jgi:putative endonuclease
MYVWFRKIFYRLFLCRLITNFVDWSSPKKSLGDRGELEAERFLLKQGLIVLERGYQDKLGEIDLIGVDNRTVVFVEVKSRTGDSAGVPADAVDQEKQAHITRTAKGYMKWHHLQEYPVRFDVVTVQWQAKNCAPRIIHYIDAFEAVGEYQMY